MDEDKSTLKANEYHPSADDALAWYKKWAVDDPVRYSITKESLASTSLSGNRGATVMLGTMNRLEAGAPVSDRYLLGLCWFLKMADEQIATTKDN